MAFGDGVSTAEALPERLQFHLRAALGPSPQVVSLCKPGSNLTHEVAVVTRLCEQIEMDLLVLCLSSDDAQPWEHKELLELDAADWEKKWKDQWAASSSTLKIAIACVEHIRKLTCERNIPLVLAFFDCPRKRTGNARRALKVICKHLELPLVDLVEVLENQEHKDKALTNEQRHPTPYAHKLAALHLAKFLIAHYPMKPTAGSESQILKQARWFEQSSKAYHFALHLAKLGDHLPQSLGSTRSKLTQAYDRILFAHLLSGEWFSRGIAELTESTLQIQRWSQMSQLGVEETFGTAALNTEIEQQFQLITSNKQQLKAAKLILHNSNATEERFEILGSYSNLLRALSEQSFHEQSIALARLTVLDTLLEKHLAVLYQGAVTRRVAPLIARTYQMLNQQLDQLLRWLTDQQERQCAPVLRTTDVSGPDGSYPIDVEQTVLYPYSQTSSQHREQAGQWEFDVPAGCIVRVSAWWTDTDVPAHGTLVVSRGERTTPLPADCILLSPLSCANY